jgi:tRNA(Glu) U13 pseudouridine synthase TruD
MQTKYRIDKSNKQEIDRFLYKVDTKQVVPVSIYHNAYNSPLFKQVVNGRIDQVRFVFKGEKRIIKSDITFKKDVLSCMDLKTEFYLVSLNGNYNIIGIHVVSNTVVNK